MVLAQTWPELGCEDGELGASPAVSTSSSASYFGTPPAKPAAEALPFECDQDHDEELSFMLLREARDAPSASWLSTQPVLSAQHRRFLVAWMQRVSSTAPCRVPPSVCPCVCYRLLLKPMSRFGPSAGLVLGRSGLCRKGAPSPVSPASSHTAHVPTALLSLPLPLVSAPASQESEHICQVLSPGLCTYPWSRPRRLCYTWDSDVALDLFPGGAVTGPPTRKSPTLTDSCKFCIALSQLFSNECAGL